MAGPAAVWEYITGHMSITGMAISFILSLALTGIAARKLRENGYVVRDMHKRGKPMVPHLGGVVIMATALVGMAAIIALSPRDLLTYEVLFAIFLFGFFGLMDDLFGFPRWLNFIGPLFLAVPVIGLLDSSVIRFWFFRIDFGWMFYLLIAPLFILTVTNLINLHSGFNGLAMGTAAMVLFSLLLKSWLYEDTSFIAFPACILGALAGFMYYNMYPSKIFEGNVGAFAVGGTIGVVIIFQGYLVTGFFMLIPHIYNFLMDIVDYLFKVDRTDLKFARIRPDGTMKVSGPYTLNYILPHYFRLTEKQCVLSMWGLTGVFCVIGLMLPPV
jgi:UDP-N-acetylglucosamine--dolichyl-phosphate N-acetylglucosaminephosphotransferase